jgi:hypothetical protein
VLVRTLAAEGRYERRGERNHVVLTFAT